MSGLYGLLLLTGAVPLFRLWRMTRRRTLSHAVIWLLVAWATACLVWLTGGGHAGRYFVLCLLTCSGIAVLGARRPGVAAWNFVVVGLLAVLCRPYLTGLGELKLEPAHLVILGGCLAVCVGNYLPTRQGIPALLFGLWAAVELALLMEAIDLPAELMPLGLAAIPWLAWAGQPRERDVWRTFRDAYGFLWAQRMREQFARAADNAGLQVELTWQGLRGNDLLAGEQLLRSVLRRFERSSGQD